MVCLIIGRVPSSTQDLVGSLWGSEIGSAKVSKGMMGHWLGETVDLSYC